MKRGISAMRRGNLSDEEGDLKYNRESLLSQGHSFLFVADSIC